MDVEKGKNMGLPVSSDASLNCMPPGIILKVAIVVLSMNSTTPTKVPNLTQVIIPTQSWGLPYLTNIDTQTLNVYNSYFCLESRES